MVSIRLYPAWLHLSAHSQIRASAPRCFGFETTRTLPFVLCCFVVAGSSLSNPIPRPRTSVTLSLGGKILC